MTAALLYSVPERIHTLAYPEHVWVETRIALGPKSVVRSITECKNDTAIDPGNGVKTRSKPVAKEARTRYAVYSVDSVNYLVAHRPLCWDGEAAPALARVSVGILEKAALGWTVRVPVNQASSIDVAEPLTRWSSSIKHKDSPALRGDEVAPNAELTTLVTNAITNGSLIAPPAAVLHGIALAEARTPRLEFAVNLRGVPEVDCKGQYDCRFRDSLFSSVPQWPITQYPATLHNAQWQIDLDTTPRTRVLYLQASKELLQRPLKLSGADVDLTKLSDSSRAVPHIFGRDNLKGYYFELQRGYASTVPLGY